MVAIEKSQPTEIRLIDIRDGIPFRYSKEGVLNPTYIKINNFIVCLESGEIKSFNEDDTVHVYSGFKVIAKPMTKSVEISRISYEKLDAGECCLYGNTIYMKIDADCGEQTGMLNLETKCVQTFEFIDTILPTPFLYLELV